MNTGPLRRLLGLARRTADPTDDSGLLARFAATRDADAFELLVWRHGGMVLGVARRVLGDEHAAEDAFQATFLALARQANSVRRDGCVAGWLHRVARRVALRARRRRDSCLRFARNVNDSSDDPVATAARRELSEVLDEELDRLPERFRRPVVLCYLEGRSTAEAAERLGCPRGTVLSRLATAREKLRVRLMRRGVAPALVPPVIHGGLNETPAALVTPTVRMAVANTAAPPVIELCDGVVRAMILSKLKLTAAVVMTVGLIGGGAGWVAMAPGGSGVALAGPQAKPEPPRSDPARQEQQQSELGAADRDRLRAELQMAEELLNDQEQRWAKQRTELRLRLAEAEEQYKRLTTDALPEAARIGEARRTLEQAQVALLRAQEHSAKPDSPPVKRYEIQVKDAENALRQLLESYEKANEAHGKRIVEARRETVMAEEKLSLFDRLTGLKRQAAQNRVQDLLTQQSQSHGNASPTDAADRRVRNLERKLDDVLRELTELRRELKK